MEAFKSKLVCLLFRLTSNKPQIHHLYCRYVQDNELMLVGMYTLMSFDITLTHCQLRTAMASYAGRPLIYGLLAATDPVRPFLSFVLPPFPA
jgi:hypothetical protein